MTPDDTAEFLVRFAQVGHAAGYSTAELEQRVQSLAASLGIATVEVSVAPTSLELAFGPIAHQEIHALRVRPGRVDLRAISRLDDLVVEVLDDRLDGAAALASLERIESTPSPQHWAVAVGSFGAVAFAMTPMLGGGWREALPACVVGIVVGSPAVPSGARQGALEPVAPPLASMAASFTAACLVHAGVGASADLVTLAALVPMLP